MPIRKAIERVENEALAVNCDWTQDSNYREGMARALQIIKEEAGLLCKECHQEIKPGQMCQNCEKKYIEELRQKQCDIKDCNKIVKSSPGIIHNLCGEHQDKFDKWQKECERKEKSQ